MKFKIALIAFAVLFFTACKNKKSTVKTDAVEQSDDKVVPDTITRTRTTTVVETTTTTEVRTTSTPDQEMSERERERRDEMNRLYSELKMSPEQAEKFKAIQLKYRDKMKAARDANADDRYEMIDAMRAVNNAKENEIKGILSLDQWATYKAFMENRREERRGMD